MVCVGDPAEVEHPFYLAYYTLQYVLTTDLGSEADLPFDHSLNKPRDGVDLIEASLGHFPIASHRTSERHGVIDGIINRSHISAPIIKQFHCGSPRFGTTRDRKIPRLHNSVTEPYLHSPASRSAATTNDPPSRFAPRPRGG